MFPVFFYNAEVNDAPGFIFIGIALILIPLPLVAVIIYCQQVIRKSSICHLVFCMEHKKRHILVRTRV